MPVFISRKLDNPDGRAAPSSLRAQKVQAVIVVSGLWQRIGERVPEVIGVFSLGFHKTKGAELKSVLAPLDGKRSGLIARVSLPAENDRSILEGSFKEVPRYRE